VLLLASSEVSNAEIRITGDRGGQIGRYVEKYERLRSSGQKVRIDGLCASACTIVLAAIPQGQNLRNIKRKPRIPRSLGFWRPRACRYESRSNTDAVFDVSLPNPAVDIFSRWSNSPHDLLKGQAIGNHVSTLQPR